MVAQIAQRQSLAMPLAVVVAILVGLVVGLSPPMAVGLFGLGLLALLAVALPVTHLALVIVFTLIVPFTIQQQIGIGGAVAAIGLLPSDVLLLAGIARGSIVVAQQRLMTGQAVALGLCVTFLFLITLQFVQGVFVYGAPVNQTGDEYRVLLGFGALIMALPLVVDEQTRPRVLRGLLAVGLLLGAWGLIQWTFQFSYGSAGDFGIRQGVALTSSGRGQLQGGLYGFPAGVIIAFAALLSGGVRSTLARGLVIACIAMNGVSALLTFERTFWVVTVLGCLYVVVRAGRAQRAKAILAAPLVIVLIFVPVALLSPDLLTTAQERLVSIGRGTSDSSVAYRVRETQQVIEEINMHPVLGSGLGASMWWGRPADGVAPEVHYFAHNGYLWLAWKLGIPGAILLIGGIVAAFLRFRPAIGDEPWVSVVAGAQGSLMALLIASVTFPAVSARPATALLGILLAISLTPRARRRQVA